MPTCFTRLGLLLVLLLPLSSPPAAAAPSVTALTLTADRVSPQPSGTTVQWTAGATGGVAPYSYMWWLYDGSAWIALSGWTSSATYTWAPAAAGVAYQIGVWVKSAGAPDTEKAIGVAFAIYPASAPTAPAKVTSLTLASDLAAPQRVGTTVRWTAAATGGTAPHSYKWWIYDGATWAPVSGWTSSATWSWAPATSNDAYQIGVWVKSAGNATDDAEKAAGVPFAISPAPPAATVTGLTLTPNLAAPEPPGVTVHWDATATGGTPPYSYMWWVFDGATWAAVSGWTTSASYAWTPATANSAFQVGVWVKSAGNSGADAEKAVGVPFAIEPPERYCASASAAIQICDSFSSGSALSAHTPDLAPSGLGWRRLTGSGDPQIGAGVVRTTGSGPQIWTTDAGLYNIAVGVDVSSAGVSPSVGLVLRATDQDNYLVLRIDTGSVARLYRWQNAQATPLGESGLTFLQGATHRLEVRAQDDVLQVYVDGIFQYAVVEAFNRAASRHGLLWNPGEDATAAFDNFQVSSSQPTNVPTTDGCAYRPDRTHVNLGPGESHFTINVIASPGCTNWSAQDGHIAYIETYVPSGVYFTMPNNTDPAPRTDYPSVAGDTITVTQAGVSGSGTGGGGAAAGSGSSTEGTTGGTTASSDLPELVRTHVPVSIPQRGTIARPYGAFIWESFPDEKAPALGECFGNCGAGCSSAFNPCGGRSQWWELTVLSEPEPIPGDTWGDIWCYGDTQYAYDFQRYRAMGRWTYHGYAAVGCYEHDSTCPEFTILGCGWFGGCGSGWDKDWSYDEVVVASRAVNIVEIGPAQCNATGGF